MKNTSLKLLLCVFSVSLLGGCANQNHDKKEEMHIIEDFKGRQVKLKKDIKKVCLTFNIEEYLAIGGEEAFSKIVGWSHSYWVNRREDALQAYSEKFPTLLDIDDIGYGGNNTLNPEKIISLNPDCVLMSASVDYSAMESKLNLFEQANIPVVFFDYHVDTKESNRKSNLILGEVLNKKERAEEISTYYENKVNYVFDKVKNLKDEEKPKVYMEFSKGKDVYGNTWSKKMWGSLIGQCGGINIAFDISDANSVDMAKEAIISNNPDLIILTGCLQKGLNGNVVLGYNQEKDQAKSALESYLLRPEWSELPAIKNRNISALYHDYSRHVFDFVGVEYLAKQMHPELFKDLNPQADFEEFFASYMPIEPKGTFMVSL